MSEHIYTSILGGLGWGIMWAVWEVYGFWWGLLYGFFWPIWVGYWLARYLLLVGGLLA